MLQNTSRTRNDVPADIVSNLRQLESTLSKTMGRLERRQIEVQFAKNQLESVQLRLSVLREDFRQYDDDHRLRKRGGIVGLRVADDSCPTCGQHIDGVLLPEHSTLRPMSPDENLAFLKDQIATFREMETDAKRSLEGKTAAVVAVAADVNDLAARVRAQKELLSSRLDAPSIAEVQERLLLQTRSEQIAVAQAALDDLISQLANFIDDWRVFRQLRDTIGEEKLTDADSAKLDEFEKHFITQLRTYGFDSYDISRISIGRQSYRPSNEGVDFGITSASDAIRVVWAYLLGLLETSRTKETNHPGLLIFDEPKQQMVANMSFQALMRRAVLSKTAGQQIIFGTSQPLAEIDRMLKGMDFTLLNFTDRIISRLPE